MSWAGMRGVVTLTAALSLPDNFPGKDVVLVAAFTVIVVTVLLQGSTLGPVASLLKFINPEEAKRMKDNEADAWRRVAEVQYRAIQSLAVGNDGVVHHPRLLEQYDHRAKVAALYETDQAKHDGIKSQHFEAVLAAIKAGRMEILRMHRAGGIHETVMRQLEHELDLQEMAAENRR
jgi:CPA1 family monovalent cation:H+ antiporter